jgi:hypothetical protein
VTVTTFWRKIEEKGRRSKEKERKLFVDEFDCVVHE